MTLTIYTKGWIHPKNMNSLQLINKRGDIKLHQWNKENNNDGIIFLFSEFDNDIINKYNNVIIGPHIILFDLIKICQKYKGKKIYVNVLSEWVRNIFLKYAKNECINYITLPFPVDVDKFIPSIKRYVNTYMIYLKDVDEYYYKLIYKYLENHEILKTFHYKIFVYGKYKEDEYLEYISNCTFGIWIGRHESQGFALEEALSCDCPLFVLDILSMKDEYNNNEKTYTYKNINMDLTATSAPYFNDKCGMICKINENEIDKKLNIFYENVINKKYEPRKYVLENLSIDNFIKQIKNYK